MVSCHRTVSTLVRFLCYIQQLSNYICSLLKTWHLCKCLLGLVAVSSFTLSRFLFPLYTYTITLECLYHCTLDYSRRPQVHSLNLSLFLSPHTPSTLSLPPSSHLISSHQVYWGVIYSEMLPFVGVVFYEFSEPMQSCNHHHIQDMFYLDHPRKPFCPFTVNPLPPPPSPRNCWSQFCF